MAALPPAFGAATAPNGPTPATPSSSTRRPTATCCSAITAPRRPPSRTSYPPPEDPLAGNAQYWLGEALYVRGQYRAAAGAFLKGYQTYAGARKAPESLLKLAMSLQRLGQKDAACSSFGELSTRFPNAPENVKTRAKSERQRIGCT